MGEAFAPGVWSLLFDVASIGLITVGMFFFIAGTAGLLRFPDVYCRLHALTKADNLGLGFVALGLVLQTDEWRVWLQLLLIWLLALAAAATITHLLGRASLRGGIEPVLGGANRVDAHAPSGVKPGGKPGEGSSPKGGAR